VTGGRPFTSIGEWDGERLRLMGWMPDEQGRAL
jgi:hypothetical protein